MESVDLVAALIVFSTMLIVSVVPVFLQRNLLHPLQSVLRGVHRVSAGDLSADVIVEVNDEIGALAANFNQMTQSLRQSKEELMQYAATLEDKVAARTIELESKNWELVVEAALERVRTIMMEMQHSEELAVTTDKLFGELRSLNILPPDAALLVSLIDPEKKIATHWATLQDGRPEQHYVPLDENAHLINTLEAWKRKEPVIVRDLSGADLRAFLTYMVELPSLKASANVEILLNPYPDRLVWTECTFNYGLLSAMTTAPLMAKSEQVLIRFAKVFEMTYRRFLDLQKAELQAHEAQIEASLERVRSRTMAMHKSDELSDVAAHLFAQLRGLGIKAFRCNIIRVDEENERWQVWATTSNGDVIPFGSLVPLTENLTVIHAYQKWKSQERSWVIRLEGEERVNFLKYFTRFIHLPEYDNIDLNSLAKQTAFFNGFYFKQGLFIIHTLEPLSETDVRIIERFSVVFEQTYTRFLDLQKAELQAREAQIEASLERVRAKAMSMRNSGDLSSTIEAFYGELNGLGLVPKRLGVGLMLDPETRTVEILSVNTAETGRSIAVPGHLVLDGHPLLDRVYHSWMAQEELFTDLRGHELKSYFIKVLQQVSIPDYSADEVQYPSYFFFAEGGLYTWTDYPLQEEEKNLYRRFKTILSLTFRRYKELQLAETNEREAIRRASLDRVRAEIASMRTASDLQRITPLIWQELTTLQVPFIRCGVFIMDDGAQRVHTYLSTPTGQAITSFDLPYETPGITTKVVTHWRHGKVFVDHWDEAQFLAWGHSLVSQGLIQTSESYVSIAPPKQLSLHFVPFHQGMLYVGSLVSLTSESLELVQTLASAFSTAYARYQDFVGLEEAKRRAEVAFFELKATQAQLIQKEKMASLGELTAGIAHEIQNPLNFVNNFAEVSMELAEELEQSLQTRDVTTASALSTDLRSNMEHIAQNGKRASGIVRAMLEHSRTSTGERQLIDLNALAEEYLKLAYHGFRAKEPDFQVQLTTAFEANLPLIEIVVQDIGRVLLNLYNNAFYAVREKQRQMQVTAVAGPKSMT